MQDWIHAAILGLIEGLTEFIPVSSTGMLLLSKQALGLTDRFWDTFCVLIQLGAIMAVVVIYFRRLWAIALMIPTQPRARNFVFGLLIAFIPAAIAGLLLHDLIKQVLFESPRLICVSLIVCNEVIEDKRSGNKTLVGLFNGIMTPRLPASHPRCNDFAS